MLEIDNNPAGAAVPLYVNPTQLAALRFTDTSGITSANVPTIPYNTTIPVTAEETAIMNALTVGSNYSFYLAGSPTAFTTGTLAQEAPGILEVRVAGATAGTVTDVVYLTYAGLLGFTPTA